ncbi:sugar kinase [Curtobacterium sp. 'Ferrero']|uniref:sugar kinase n=1 Tax=Curtobacterium sp. 'Ferrero' TaxID=2033654 RepID=UPI000BCF971B|nr:sugar kinase [Curtobacterium sp. 'Ferrero']PCN49065.1 sugar kinase [Curtobacterium sp. 'Ferrero']
MTGPVVTFGETMLLLGGRGPLTDLDAVTVDTGGAESNVAIGLARAGVPATWIGRVGTDPAGDRVLADVRGAGVEVVGVRDPDRSTGLMLKERLPDGRTRVSYHRRGSAGSALSPADLPAGVVERAALLHCTGITPVLSTSARASVDAALDRAHAADVPVSFDVNHRPKLVDVDTARSVYRAIAVRSTVVFAGDDEARLVLGRDERPDDEAALAHDLAALAQGTAVVKLGSRGAVASVDGVLHRRPATPVRVVDPVGAGDAFVAAWLAGMLAGAAPEDGLARAADAGARACTWAGDWERAVRAGGGGEHEGVDAHHLDDHDHVVHDRVDR